MAEAKLKIVDDRTIILELLRTYNGESFVYEHNNSSERRQGYHLNDKPGLTTFDILNGIRIPIKDIGALVIKLGTMEERLEIDLKKDNLSTSNLESRIFFIHKETKKYLF